MTDARSHQMNMREMSMGQKIDLVAGILSYPALTILIFCRRRVGFRTIRPFQLVLMFLLMQSIPPIFSQHCTLVNGCSGGSPNSEAFSYFTWVMLIVGFVQRWIRWRELASGKPWHSYSRGISYFEFISRIPLPIPGFRRIPITFIYRIVDAVAVACIAMLIGGIPGFHGLAQWLFFSAMCMLFVENYVYDKQLDRELDLLDAMVEGEMHSRLVQKFSGVAQGQVVSPGLGDTAGIPTGIGPDIVRQVEARRTKTVNVPGNAVTT